MVIEVDGPSRAATRMKEWRPGWWILKKMSFCLASSTRAAFDQGGVHSAVLTDGDNS